MDERQKKIRLALDRAALFWKIIGDAGVPTSLGMKIGSAKFEALGDDEKFLLAKVANDLVKADAKIKAEIAQEAEAQEAISAAAQAAAEAEAQAEIEAQTAQEVATEETQEVTEAAATFEIRKAP